MIYILIAIGAVIGLIAGIMGYLEKSQYELICIVAGIPFAVAAFYLIDKRDAERTGEKIDELE